MQLHKSDLEDNIAEYIHERMPAYQMDVLVDCGANAGWFTYQFLRVYSSVKSYCLEPVPSIANALKKNLSGFPDLDIDSRVFVHQTAISDYSGSAIITNQPDVTINRIINTPIDQSIIVPIITGDDFCIQNKIERINYLKIDCEGEDIRVLHGFSEMISSSKIDFIQVEVCIGDRIGIQKPMELFEKILIPKGYKHFRFINQASDGAAFISRADVVFINHNLAKNYHELFFNRNNEK
jgi:FkbM family methyltransferase